MQKSANELTERILAEIGAAAPAAYAGTGAVCLAFAAIGLTGAGPLGA